MHLRAALVAIPLLCACSQATTNPEVEQAAAPRDDMFYSLLGLTRANYIPLSADELASESEVIATGHFVKATEGMSVRSNGAIVPSGLQTVVATLEVSDPIKGVQTGEQVYVEFIHGGAVPAATYADHLPQEPVTVFLGPAEWLKSDDVEYIGEGTGYPPGSRLYRLRTPQGFLIARDGKLLQPLESEGQNQLFGAELTSLQDVEEWYESWAAADTESASDAR